MRVDGAAGVAPHTVGTELVVQESFFQLDLWVMLAASVLIAAIVLFKRPSTRWLGLALTLGYLGYIAVLARSAMG